MFNIVILYMTEEQEIDVVRSTTAVQDISLEPVVRGQDIIEFQKLVRRVPVSDPVMRYAVHLARHSRPGEEGVPDFVNKWLDYGASVRAAQYLILGSKARALMNGRYHVSYEDIRALAQPVFRHRLLTNFHAESERLSTDKIIEQLIEAVPVPKSQM
jgi:MoxR-like ATPase